MAIRLGNNKWNYKEAPLKSADLNDTFSEVSKLNNLAVLSLVNLKRAKINNEITYFYFPVENVYVESFSVSTGDDNKVDTTNTTAIFDVDGYTCGFATTTILYDDFNDGVIDSTKWDTNTYAGATISESSGNLYLNIPSSRYSTVSNVLAVSIKKSSRFKISVSSVYVSTTQSIYDSAYAEAQINLVFSGNSEVVVLKKRSDSNGYSGDLGVGTYDIIVDLQNKSISVYDSSTNTLINTINYSYEGVPKLKFFCKAFSPNSGDSAQAQLKIDFVEMAEYDTNNEYYVQTTSLFNGDNLSKIFVGSMSEYNESTMSIKYDVSTDGGNTWEVTDVSIGEEVKLNPTTGMDIVLRFKLNTSDEQSTPKLKNYVVYIK